MPIIVGGNGPNVMWRMAARHAEEVSLDSISIDKDPGAAGLVRAGLPRRRPGDG
jgi:hypothetical protein